MGRPPPRDRSIGGRRSVLSLGMRPGHGGSPALNTPPTAWRASTWGAPVTAEGGGPVTTPERGDPTRVQLNQTTPADRANHARDTVTNTTMDGAESHGTTSARHGRARTRGCSIGSLPAGSDERKIVRHFNIWNGLRRNSYSLRLLWSRDRPERTHGNRKGLRTRLPHSHHARGPSIHAIHLLPHGYD